MTLRTALLSALPVLRPDCAAGFAVQAARETAANIRRDKKTREVILFISLRFPEIDFSIAIVPGLPLKMRGPWARLHFLNHKDTKGTKSRENLCALCVFVV